MRMALLSNLKLWPLLSSEIRCPHVVLPLLQSSLQICVSSLTWPLEDQRRYYKRFHRRPVKVTPAKEDEGKMLLGDYVDKATPVNAEVIEETKRLAAVQRMMSASETSGAAMRKREEKMLLNNGMKAKEARQPAHNKAKEYIDPAIKEALRPIKYVQLEEAPMQLRSLLSQCSSRKLRNRHDVVMLEGTKLIQEVLSAGILPFAIYYSRKNLLLKVMPKSMAHEEKVERLNSMNIFSMPYRKMKTWSSVVTGQGVMGVFKLSDMTTAYTTKRHSERLPLKSSALGSHVTVVLDSVREPGNVGALIRTAAGAGVHKIVLTKGCCDPWDSKALRAGCGSHLCLEICEGVPWSRIYATVGRYPVVHLADIGNSDREPLRDVEDADPDEHAVEDRRKIGTADSAPVKRVLVKRGDCVDDDDVDEEEEEEEETFFGPYVEVQEDGSEHFIDGSFLDDQHLQQFVGAKYPTKYIHEVDFFRPETWQSQNIVLVMGGETGLSAEAKKFMQDNFGSLVSVPLHNHVDSLNTSVAGGIILFEMFRQLQDAQTKSGAQVEEVASM